MVSHRAKDRRDQQIPAHKRERGGVAWVHQLINGAASFYRLQGIGALFGEVLGSDHPEVVLLTKPIDLLVKGLIVEWRESPAGIGTTDAEIAFGDFVRMTADAVQCLSDAVQFFKFALTLIHRA